MSDELFRIVISVGVGIASIAFVVQAFVVLALYRTGRKMQEKVDSLTGRIEPLMVKVGPIMDKVGPVIEKAGPVIERVRPLLDRAAPTIERIGPVVDKTKQPSRMWPASPPR